MIKSTVGFVNELKKQLLEFPSLVNALEQKKPDFLQHLEGWMKTVEEMLHARNIARVSQLSGHRSQIISAKLIDNNRKVNKRKRQLQKASGLLFDIQSIVLDILMPEEEKVNQARELIRQLLQIINQSEAITYDPVQSFETFVDTLWSMILTHEQLKAGAVKLKTNFTQNDIRLLIAEEVQTEEFSLKKSSQRTEK